MHRSPQKRNKTQRIGQTLGLINHFNKTEDLGFHETINNGEVIRKYMIELMEEKDYLAKSVM